MKATDFNLQRDIQFNLSTGITTFKNSRLVILDAGALGLLRQKLIKELGVTKARNLFFQFGFQNGYADFMQMKMNYTFDTPQDLLASGPVIHTWEGIVQATPKDVKLDLAKKEISFTGVWKNSYEAEQHLCFNSVAKDPVCWSLTGYASGWTTAFIGKPHLAMEPACMGKGDPNCEWDIRPLEAWGAKGKKYGELIHKILQR
jgi:hypothetical protein